MDRPSEYARLPDPPIGGRERGADQEGAPLPVRLRRRTALRGQAGPDRRGRVRRPVPSSAGQPGRGATPVPGPGRRGRLGRAPALPVRPGRACPAAAASGRGGRRPDRPTAAGPGRMAGRGAQAHRGRQPHAGRREGAGPPARPGGPRSAGRPARAQRTGHAWPGASGGLGQAAAPGPRPQRRSTWKPLSTSRRPAGWSCCGWPQPSRPPSISASCKDSGWSGTNEGATPGRPSRSSRGASPAGPDLSSLTELTVRLTPLGTWWTNLLLRQAGAVGIR